MTTATLAPGGPQTGYGTLLRLAGRRDRRRLLIWVFCLGLVTVYATTALGLVYPTAQDRAGRAQVIDTPAGILLGGPGYGIDSGYPLGAMIANELGLSVMVAVAIMSIQLVVRHTRAAEEDGSAELLLSAPVGHRAPLLSALSLTALADLAVAAVVTVGLLAGGLDAVDSVAMALAWGLTGLVFGAAAAVTSQVFEQARAATGSALALLGAAALVRGVGDIIGERGSALSWFSPIAWAQQIRAFVDLRWWPLLLSLAATGVLLAVAHRLSAGRDFGAGLRAPRRGPATASPLLSGPFALLARLQRGTVVGWGIAAVLIGVTFGSLADAVVEMIEGNDLLADVLAAGGHDVTADFAAVAALYLALTVAAFAVASVLRLRGEEDTGRAELMLSGALSRPRLLGVGLALAAVASTVLLAVAALANGLAAAAVRGDAGQVGRQLAAGMVHLPAVWLTAAVAALLVGAAPRLAGLVWVLVGWSVLSGMFGPLLDLPGAVLKLSPFAWVPRVPAEDVDVAALAGLTAVAALCSVLALVAFRRRDVPPA